MTPTLGIPPRHALFRVFLIGDSVRALSIDIGGLSPISNLVAWRRGVLESTCSYATLFHLGVRGGNRTLHRGCAADFAEGARPVCRHGTCGSGGGSSAGPAAASAQAPGVCAGAAERDRVGAPGRAGHAAEDRYPAHDGASCDGFGRVGNHLGGRTDLAYGDPFSGFARHAGGVRRLLGRRGQGLGARRQPGGRPVHRARPVRRRTFLERRGILRVGHRGVPARTRCAHGTAAAFYDPRHFAPGAHGGRDGRRRGERSRGLLRTRRQLLPGLEGQREQRGANLVHGQWRRTAVFGLSAGDTRQQLQALFPDGRPLHQ